MSELPKLVRDNIPDIIRADGRQAVTAVLSDDAYVAALQAKLQEEVVEYLTDKNVEELADILEVVQTLAAVHGATPEILEAVRQQKASKNGGFANRIELQQVI